MVCLGILIRRTRRSTSRPHGGGEEIGFDARLPHRRISQPRRLLAQHSRVMESMTREPPPHIQSAAKPLLLANRPQPWRPATTQRRCPTALRPTTPTASSERPSKALLGALCRSVTPGPLRWQSAFLVRKIVECPEAHRPAADRPRHRRMPGRGGVPAARLGSRRASANSGSPFLVAVAGEAARSRAARPRRSADLVRRIGAPPEADRPAPDRPRHRGSTVPVRPSG